MFLVLPVPGARCPVVIWKYIGLGSKSPTVMPYNGSSQAWIALLVLLLDPGCPRNVSTFADCRSGARPKAISSACAVVASWARGDHNLHLGNACCPVGVAIR